MKLTVRVEPLELRHTFTIARGSSSISETIIAEVEHDGTIGRGEARPISFYGESPAEAAAQLETLAPWLQSRDPRPYRALLSEADVELARQVGAEGHHRGALCALDLAVHDWVGNKLGVPLHALLGLRSGPLPQTSFTIGIDTIDAMVEKLRLASDAPIIKIKLGTEEDVEIVRALREKTQARIRVDANCAWGVDETIEKSRQLAALGVEFIEQPMPPAELDKMEAVFRHSALPILADENSAVPKDVAELRGRFHGINIKLVKCGGIQPALRMVALARTFGLEVMLGCMVESSLGITAAAHIGSLADYLDLDGPLLITNDPFEGVTYRDGRPVLPDGSGLGVSPRSP